jgi:hypothetical protein
LNFIERIEEGLGEKSQDDGEKVNFEEEEVKGKELAHSIVQRKSSSIFDHY